jgi:hypothetical protein
MSWYIWKRWRFAWSCGWGTPFKRELLDGNGEWMCVFGKLFFLVNPKIKTTLREKAIATGKFLISDTAQFLLLLGFTVWLFASLGSEIGEVRPSYTTSWGMLLNGAALMIVWMRFGSLSGLMFDRLLKRLLDRQGVN